MLMGEHAVLRNHLALAASLNRRLSLELIPISEPVLRIESDIGSACFKPSELPHSGPFRFVAQCFKSDDSLFSQGGFELRIQSELPTTVGLGSSAALAVALVSAIRLMQNLPCEDAIVHEQALAIVRAVQGRGSGADVAASVLGGCVAYRVEPREMRKLTRVPPMAVYYCGAKRPTPEVVAEVDAFEARNPELATALFQNMGALSLEAEHALAGQDWRRLGELMNVGQGLMDAIGVNDARLSGMIYALRAATGVRGCKISGSGLGDCVIALGDPPRDVLPDERVEVCLGPDGVREEGL